MLNNPFNSGDWKRKNNHIRQAHDTNPSGTQHRQRATDKQPTACPEGHDGPTPVGTPHRIAPEHKE